MPKKNSEYFYLLPREEEVMKSLWAADNALSASEIANGIPNRTWPASSVQGILRNLEAKNAVKVDSITKLGKSYGRLFRPTLSANEYAVMQFERYYQTDKTDKSVCLSMMSALLGNISSEKNEVIDTLHTLIDAYEEKENM